MRKIASVPDQKLVNYFPRGVSRLAALLLDHICQIFSLVAPCQSGAALRERVTEPLIQDTRHGPNVSGDVHFILLP